MNFGRLFKPISISLSPNVQSDDIVLALKLLLQPWTWTSGKKISELENKFKEYQGVKYAYGFNSGRSALFTILEALNIKDGDEVLLQAFTCNAVPNPVLWSGGTPIYVDIDESLNIDPLDLERKITPKSKAIIVQHTFGIPAKIDTLLEISRRHNLIFIEDCAHGLGAEYPSTSSGKANQRVGTFGDVSFFSFGRDKVISSVWGGMITTNNDDLARKIEHARKKLPMPSISWTLRQILHPILFSIIIPTYHIFGKYFLVLLKSVRGVGLAVSQKERRGQKPDMFPARMPNALGIIALHQFEKLEKYNKHRRKIAKLYFDELKAGTVLALPAHIEEAIYLRFNTLYPEAKKIIKEAKRKHILLGDWYSNLIDPKGTDFEKMKYVPASCPNAEKVAKESVNLPTHINISTENAKRIVQYLRNYK